jgi:hypothetical protein
MKKILPFLMIVSIVINIVLYKENYDFNRTKMYYKSEKKYVDLSLKLEADYNKLSKNDILYLNDPIAISYRDNVIVAMKNKKGVIGGNDVYIFNSSTGKLVDVVREGE